MQSVGPSEHDEGLTSPLSMTPEQPSGLAADHGATPALAATHVATPTETTLRLAGRNGDMPAVVRQPVAAKPSNHVKKAVQNTVNAVNKTVDFLVYETSTSTAVSVSVRLSLGRRLMARDLGRDRVADFNAAWTTVESSPDRIPQATSRPD